MKKIIITGIGGDIAQAAAKALGRQKFFLIGTDCSDVPVAGYFVGRFYRLPPAKNEKEYLEKLKSVIRKEKPAFVIPVPEPELRTLNKNRETLKSCKTRFVMHDASVLDIFLDKLRTAEFLRSRNISSPATVLLEDWRKSGLKLPMIVKTRFGWGGRQNWVVRDQIDLDYVLRKNDGTFIAQEYLNDPGDEFTTGVFSDGQKIESISFQRKLGYGGLSREIILTDDPRLEDLARRIALAVGLKGSLNVQSRFHRGEYIPFEINPRISSTLLFRKKFGFDDINWWLGVLQNKSFHFRKKFSAGRGHRILSEIYADMTAV